jgi:hypothetical protein
MSNLPPPPPGGSPPPPTGGAPSPTGGAKPDNYLVWAILSTLFCCLPLGVVSIVFAAQVDSKYNAGDYVGAQDASDKAKNFAIAAAAVGLVVLVIYVIAIAASA